MKILALNGSYRTNGNTARVIELLAEQLRHEAARAGWLKAALARLAGDILAPFVS